MIIPYIWKNKKYSKPPTSHSKSNLDQQLEPAPFSASLAGLLLP